MKPYGPLSRTVQLRRKTDLRRGAPLKRGPWRRVPKAERRETVPVDVRAKVRERSGGVCEIGVFADPAGRRRVCTGVATDVHHRALLGMGGCHGVARERADRVSSLADSCRACHRFVHEHRDGSGADGLIIPRGADSTAVPMRRRGVLVYLSDDGGIHNYESACA